MVDVVTTAKYITQRYERTFNTPLDEMKLHKLLYFVQRESLLLFDKPLFAKQFEAWRYGPVMPCLRTKALHVDYDVLEVFPELGEYAEAFDTVFRIYAPMKSWSLSNISHGETCWRKAKDKEKGGNPVEIRTDDIREDAESIRMRRIIFA